MVGVSRLSASRLAIWCWSLERNAATKAPNEWSGLRVNVSSRLSFMRSIVAGVRCVGNIGNDMCWVYVGNIGNDMCWAHVGNIGNDMCWAYVGNIGNDMCWASVGNIGNYMCWASVENIGNEMCWTSVGNIGNEMCWASVVNNIIIIQSYCYYRNIVCK